MNLYTILVNDSFEYGYDLSIIDNSHDKLIISNSTICLTNIYEVLEYIKKAIEIYENEKDESLSDN